LFLGLRMKGAVALVVLLFSQNIDRVPGFRPSPFSCRTLMPTQILMVGGKSKEELNLSKKQLFGALKEKFNKAASIPGFFEVGEGPAVCLHIFLRVFNFADIFPVMVWVRKSNCIVKVTTMALKLGIARSHNLSRSYNCYRNLTYSYYCFFANSLFY